MGDAFLAARLQLGLAGVISQMDRVEILRLKWKTE